MEIERTVIIEDSETKSDDENDEDVEAERKQQANDEKSKRQEETENDNSMDLRNMTKELFRRQNEDLKSLANQIQNDMRITREEFNKKHDELQQKIDQNIAKTSDLEKAIKQNCEQIRNEIDERCDIIQQSQKEEITKQIIEMGVK